ncbi:hypothetical protein B0J18DRAFT_178585 [Chaetomium sp. MPI-SDFR-AT-0129]|nr:hypothetical protein B0J18DRAFT_178585 [Chaetomium sp. MPI-SDFR-AT-0129]
MAAADKNGGKAAPNLEKMIHDARDRKKNEALAAKIFNKDRPSPASNKSSPSPAGSLSGSLASRAGVKKRAEPASRLRHSTGNIDGEWTHDLHREIPRGPRAQQNTNGNNGSKKASGSGAGSLAARITDPNAPYTGPASHHRQTRRAARVAQALIRTELQSSRGGQQQQQQQKQQPTNGNTPIPTGPKAMTQKATAASSFNKGMTIRGLAGPFVVMAQNFAPGTTAADIESAVTPVGGIVTDCRIIKHHPLVIAEIVFESKEGADNVVNTFNNQTADGRVLSVYLKPGNTPSTPATTTRRASYDQQDAVVDGSYGFDDPMDTDRAESKTSTGNGKAPPTGPAAGSGGLYSDSLMKTNRWGRGFSGGAGRSGR